MSRTTTFNQTTIIAEAAIIRVVQEQYALMVPAFTTVRQGYTGAEMDVLTFNQTTIIAETAIFRVLLGRYVDKQRV